MFSDLSCFDESASCFPIIKLFANLSNDLIVVFEDKKLLFMNQAFLNFTRTDSCQFFVREYGCLINRFVPHDDYFHLGQVDDQDHWLDAIDQLDDDKKVISMFDFKIEPHAFSFEVHKPNDSIIILIFTDITQKLIERIMSENDANIDESSGAFTKDYFIHTFKSFQDAAVFNKKSIACTLIQASDMSHPKSIADEIKLTTRKNDMLIRWNESQFIIAYLVDTDSNAQSFSHKISQLSFQPVKVRTSLIEKGETPDEMIMRLNN